MARKKTARPTKTRAPKVPRKARQKTLPGFESIGIKAIENAAHSYVDARDERMRLTEVEAKRHALLLAVMKKHNKKHYRHRNGEEIIEIDITAKDPEERAKVKVRPATSENIEALTNGRKTKAAKKSPRLVVVEDIDEPGRGDEALDEPATSDDFDDDGARDAPE